MTISCSNCGKKTSFSKKEDYIDIRKAGWVIIGILINDNSYYYACPDCEKEITKKNSEIAKNNVRL